MRILFCVNWAVNSGVQNHASRFSPECYSADQPYWFFRHIDSTVEIDVLDCGNPLGLEQLELKLTRCLPTQSVAAYLRSKRYDLVLSHGGQSGLGFGLLQTLMWQRRPPHVLFDVGCITGGSTNSMMIGACRMALRSLAATICHSSYQLGFYREHFPALAKNAHFIPLGVDTEEFRPRSVQVEDQIICVGYAKRDWKVLVNAYRTLQTQTRLVLLGIPAHERIACEGVVPVPRVGIEEMRNWIARSRFVVLPLPALDYCVGQQTFLQSMALGKTVLASNIPAVRDYFSDGQNGFLYEAGDIGDLQCKLRLLLASPKTVEKVGHVARERVERDFSEATMAHRIMQVLEKTVKPS